VPPATLDLAFCNKRPEEYRSDVLFRDQSLALSFQTAERNSPRSDLTSSDKVARRALGSKSFGREIPLSLGPVRAPFRANSKKYMLVKFEKFSLHSKYQAIQHSSHFCRTNWVVIFKT
jgi:hypothetical protein